MTLPRPIADRIARLRQGPLWRLVSETAWEHRRAYAAALLLMGIVAGMGGAIALTVEEITDELFFRQNADRLGLLALWVLGVFLLRGAAMYGQTVILARVGNRIVADLQRRIYAHVLAQGLAFHQGHDSGDLATRMTYNAAAAREALRVLATRLGVDLMTVLVLLGVMIYQDPALSALALIGLPLALAGVAWLVARVRRLARREVTLYGRILSGMTETVAGARVIKTFRLEDRMRARMDGAIEGVREQADGLAVMRGLVNPLMETFAGLAAAGVILYGGWRVSTGAIEVGTFFSFLTALVMAGDPGRRLAQLHISLKRHMAGVEFIYEVLDTRLGMTERAGARPLPDGPGEVRLEGVHFTYPGGEGAALRGLTLTARAGRVTALVGPSGGGKSTALALVPRFHDPDAGRVAIDGHDLRDVTLDSLRARIALVTQDTFLFDDTVAGNIRVGRAEAGDAEVEAAARAANAHGFVSALPEGYATPLGEGGARLSGGERQRIAIARAMLADAPILLLDEATSALDAETEAAVQEALARLMRGRTTIVVAHRLSTIRRADTICVLDGGRVAEQGSHRTLLAAGGLYARLSALQSQDADAEERA
jgi:ATP-binding cassette subfamily B protein